MVLCIFGSESSQRFQNSSPFFDVAFLFSYILLSIEFLFHENADPVSAKCDYAELGAMYLMSRVSAGIRYVASCSTAYRKSWLEHGTMRAL